MYSIFYFFYMITVNTNKIKNKFIIKKYTFNTFSSTFSVFLFHYILFFISNLKKFIIKILSA